MHLHTLCLGTMRNKKNTWHLEYCCKFSLFASLYCTIINNIIHDHSFYFSPKQLKDMKVLLQEITLVQWPRKTDVVLTAGFSCSFVLGPAVRFPSSQGASVSKFALPQHSNTCPQFLFHYATVHSVRVNVYPIL